MRSIASQYRRMCPSMVHARCGDHHRHLALAGEVDVMIYHLSIGRSCGRGGVDELQYLQPNNDVVHEHAEEERTGDPFAIAATSPHQWTLENVLESSDGCSELTWSLAQRSRRVDNVARQ